jgi:hypothetical protein
MPALEGRTLLDELNHRIKNELASVINLVTFKAVWTDSVEAKEELSNVVDLLHQHAQVHSILTMPDRDALVDAGEQLRKQSRTRWPPPENRSSIEAYAGAASLAPGGRAGGSHRRPTRTLDRRTYTCRKRIF